MLALGIGLCLKVRGWSRRQSTPFSISRFLYSFSSSRIWGILWFLIGIGRRATIMTGCVKRMCWIFEDRLPIVIYTAHAASSPAKFERCIPSLMNIMETSVSLSLNVSLTTIRTLLSTGISAYMCLTPPVGSVHLMLQAFRWRIVGNATWCVVNEMLGKEWLPHQLSETFDDVPTPLFDRPLVIVIRSHILGSVSFHLLESQNLWHASHGPLDTISIFDAWQIQSRVFLSQHVVIVCLHSHLLDPTLDIFGLFTHRKHVVGIVPQGCLKAIMSIVFPWLSNVFAQRSARAGV